MEDRDNGLDFNFGGLTYGFIIGIQIMSWPLILLPFLPLAGNIISGFITNSEIDKAFPTKPNFAKQYKKITNRAGKIIFLISLLFLFLSGFIVGCVITSCVSCIGQLN